MPRIVLGIVLVAASSPFAARASGQTAAVNPQRPARTVESVQPTAKVAAAAARIDALLERGLQRMQQAPLPIADDATFVRRAYLTIVGRIPTLAETEAFFADAAPDRRTALCDRLLDSPGRTSHFANFWFDLLRVETRLRQASGEPFAHWIRESIQQDKPFDRFAAEMLTARGPAHERGNGATGFLLRDMNMPHDAMANTLRLFLGTRLECAQCHNHPFDAWTQKEFYAMAAFFGGIGYRDAEVFQSTQNLRQELAGEDERTRTAVRQLLIRLGQGIDGTGTGVERLPADYRYDDAKPGAPVLADTLFGADVKLRYDEKRLEQKKKDERLRPRDRRQRAPEVDSRAALADWMTSSKNPLFAKVIANRMWARTFGRGLVEPVDDWKKDTAAVHPELLAQLEKLIVELGFDLRQFERVLVHTQLFQRESPCADPPADAAYAFPGPLLRRMSAEQLHDSLLTLVFDDIDERLRPMDERAREYYELQERAKGADAKQLVALVEERRDPQRRRELQQMQQQESRMAMAADAEAQQRARPLLQKLTEARRRGDRKEVVAIAEELERMGVPIGRRAARGREGDLLRASDLQQPAPPGHLLRQFGQSDRGTVDAATTAATVPQVLTLLNGFLDQRVLGGASALKRDLDLAADGERRVRVAFLTTLNRAPLPDELAAWRKTIATAADPAAAVKDLVWVLCNSNEFRFVR
jgi:hypothetical protein